MVKRWGLRVRFLLVLVGLLLTVFTAIALIIVRQSASTLKSNLIDQSKTFASLATQPIGDSFVLYQNSGTIDITKQIQGFTSLDHNIKQVEIVDTTGKQLFTNDKTQPISVSSNQAVSLDLSYIYDSSGNLKAIVQPYLENFGVHRYAIVYGISYQSVNDSIKRIVTSIVILSVAVLLVSLVVWYILINRLFLRPVAQLSQLAFSISRGDLDRQIRLGRNDEIGDLANAVNTMADYLKADIAKLKQVDKLKNEFMMITSHNLRTPITVIKSYINEINLLNPPKEIKDLLAPIEVNSMRLGSFAEDVLTISTIEAGQNILHPEPTAIAPVLEAIVKDFSLMADQKKIHFTSHIDTTAKVNLSKAHFRSALWNLLDNAFKFTHKGGSIELSAHSAGSELKVSVKDSGIGISAKEVPNLFTKFHRSTDLLAYNYEGTGIGLYITKLIIEQHGGHVEVESVEGQGTTFTIVLPVLPT